MTFEKMLNVKYMVNTGNMNSLCIFDGGYLNLILHFLMEMFLALLPMVYIFLSLFVLLECALMLMTSTTETYF